VAQLLCMPKAQRGRITQRMISEQVGDSQILISSVYGGMNETPSLQQLLPFLNFHEWIGITGSSWLNREHNPQHIRDLAGPGQEDMFSTSELYRLVDGILEPQDLAVFPFRGASTRMPIQTGLTWQLGNFTGGDVRNVHYWKKLNTNVEQGNNINPYRTSLERRMIAAEEKLTDTNSDFVEQLRQELLEPTKVYVFESQYEATKQELGGDSRGIVLMSFQKVYPRKGQIVPAYAGAIARELRDSPRELRGELM